MKHASPESPHIAFWPGRISALLPLLLFIWFALQLSGLQESKRMVFAFDWVPSMGVDLVLSLDGISALFALIITGIGALVLVYADAYMGGHPHLVRFYFYLHAFLYAMLGLVLADNLMLLFVFWELTTVFSFLLIGFEHGSEKSRSSARQAMLVTGAGGLLLLVGIVLIGQTGGSYSWKEVYTSGDLVRNHTLYLPIFLCIVIGAFTKSAQMPFHFWLPNAMSAPTPISAFLHSATMVKAGIYLLMRMHPILGGTMVWMTTLVLAGAATAVWGAIVALGQTDLKRMLAHTTIMALGTITMFLGSRTTPALTAAVTFLLVHALYKSALFMVVGNIDHQAGTRRLEQIGGMGPKMPFTAVAAAMATLSMAGFPLFLGFIGKEIMYKGALTEDVFPALATTAALAANSLMTAVAGIIALRPFWGRRRGAQPSAESPWQMWIGPLLLSATGLFFGIVPEWVGRWLVEPGVLAFHPTTEVIKLKLFYGVNEPLLLSLLTMTLGALIYVTRRSIRGCINWATSRIPLSLERVYDGLLYGVMRVSAWLTDTLQNGSLFRYLTTITGVIVLGVGWMLLSSVRLETIALSGFQGAWQALLSLLMLASVAVAVSARSRLLSICALGVIGAATAVIFLSHGAPDVALTQLLVETLTLIIAAIVLLRLPRIPIKAERSGRLRQLLRVLVACGSGLMVTMLLLSVGQTDVDRTVTSFYEQASYLKAHGRNVVNVILVDFRSLDTLGEIIVVAASAVAALALIRKRRRSA